MLAVCDAKYKFTLVDIGARGRRSDSGIFMDSEFGKKFERNEMNVPPPAYIGQQNRFLCPYFLVADEAFPLKHYIMRPYPKRNLTIAQLIYNYRLSRARRMIENCFGILASKWRIFRKPIIGSVETAKSIVEACICLHNWLRIDDEKNKPSMRYLTADLVDREVTGGVQLNGSWRGLQGGAFSDITRAGSNNYVQEISKIRENLTKYFMNEGEVDWQYAYCTTH